MESRFFGGFIKGGLFLGIYENLIFFGIYKGRIFHGFIKGGFFFGIYEKRIFRGIYKRRIFSWDLWKADFLGDL